MGGYRAQLRVADAGIVGGPVTDNCDDEFDERDYSRACKEDDWFDSSKSGNVCQEIGCGEYVTVFEKSGRYKAVFDDEFTPRSYDTQEEAKQAAETLVEGVLRRRRARRGEILSNVEDL